MTRQFRVVSTRCGCFRCFPPTPSFCTGEKLGGYDPKWSKWRVSVVERFVGYWRFLAAKIWDDKRKGVGLVFTKLLLTSQCLTFQTFWDCIFSRKNKVQTFISGSFGSVRMLNCG